MSATAPRAAAVAPGSLWADGSAVSLHEPGEGVSWASRDSLPHSWPVSTHTHAQWLCRAWGIRNGGAFALPPPHPPLGHWLSGFISWSPRKEILDAAHPSRSPRDSGDSRDFCSTFRKARALLCKQNCAASPDVFGGLVLRGEGRKNLREVGGSP